MSDIMLDIEYLVKLGVVTNKIDLNTKHLDIDYRKLRLYAYHICCTFSNQYIFVDASLPLLNQNDLMIGGPVPIEIMETFFRHNEDNDLLGGTPSRFKRPQSHNVKKMKRKN